MAAQCCSRRLAARPCSPLAGAQEGGAATPFLNQWRRLASYMLPEDIAKGIALDAQANLGGLEARRDQRRADVGRRPRQYGTYAVLPMRDRKSFAANLVTLATDQNAFLAQVNRTAVIIALDELRGGASDQVAPSTFRKIGLNPRKRAIRHRRFDAQRRGARQALHRARTLIARGCSQLQICLPFLTTQGAAEPQP
jgi:hypothetical protein